MILRSGGSSSLFLRGEATEGELLSNMLSTDADSSMDTVSS
jgi:hypothetical protein